LNRHRRIAASLSRSRPNVLAVVAHPDDAEVRFGGTLLRLAREGAGVYVLVATRGDKNCVDASVPSRALPRIRRREQLAAARLAGYRRVVFLGLPDGGLDRRRGALRERVAYHIRLFRPRTVVTFDPQTFYLPAGRGGPIQHPDHRAVGEAVLAAVHSGAPNPYAHPRHRRSGLEPWAVDEVLLADAAQPNYRVDVRPFLALKRRVVRVYRSQGLDRRAVLASFGRTETFRRLDCSRPPLDPAR
jgi:LmbE family N-acetylglucosaminyl deacetylase